MKKIIAVVLTIELICFSSCSSQTNTDTKMPVVSVGRESSVYSLSSHEIVDPEYYCTAYSVIEDSGNYYVIAEKNNVDDMNESYKSMYVISSSDDSVQEISIDQGIEFYSQADISGDEFLYITAGNQVRKMNLETNEILFEITFEDIPSNVEYTDDGGFIVVFLQKIQKYDSNNIFVGEIENLEWTAFNTGKCLFSIDSEMYFLTNLGQSINYYRLDFNNGTSSLVYDTSTDSLQLLGGSGQYLFTDEGEYMVNIAGGEMNPLAMWTEIDFKPERYQTIRELFIGVDSEQFVNVYCYANGIIELNIYTLDINSDNSNRIPITVGGFGCMYDMPLRWAIYNYNTSQTEYRVYIEDYSKIFDFSSIENVPSQYAALIQYFNDGNSPDIFCSSFFDYDYFFENGYIQDISPYMDEKFIARFNGVTDNIRSLMCDEDGSIYRIFASYQLNGYYGSYDVFGENNNITIDDWISIAQENHMRIVENETSDYMALKLLKYSYIENYSVEELSQILNFIYANSVSDLNYSTTYSMDYNTINEIALFSYGIWSPFVLYYQESCTNSRLTYVGYPSLSRSYHVLSPLGIMAISSTTEFPEECAKIISNILDEDVQNMSYMHDSIPVVDSVFNYYLGACVDHSLIGDNLALLRWTEFSLREITPECAEDFRNACYSADTVEFYDWGISSIISDEVMSYYTDGKNISEIAQILHSRIQIYTSEN